MFERQLRRKVDRKEPSSTSVEPPLTERRAIGQEWSAMRLGDSVLQAKLTVGPAGDRFEREADAVAARVVRALRAPDPASTSGPEQVIPPAPRIQRAAHLGAGGGLVDEATEREVTSAVGRGAPMARAVRARFEPAFGTDFGAVRLHDGAAASDLNDRIQAEAFTTGNDIFFRDGLPDTSTSDGQHLLAHELTHTIQQRGTGNSVALQRKGGKGGAKKGAKKGGAKKGGGGGGGKGAGGKGGQQQQNPAKELTAEELAQRAEKARVASEAAAARKVEKERLAAEAEAVRVAQEEEERKQRIARGRHVWRGLADRLWASVPAAVKDQKGSDGKVVFTKHSTTTLIAASFGELKASLETGDFDVDETDDELIGDEDELRVEWDEFLWDQVGVKLGTQVPVKAKFFAHIGWGTVSGLAWDLKAKGQAPSGFKVHLTLSGNSMLAPQSIVAKDEKALERTPATIFDELFMTVFLTDRVHCTRESNPVKHLYLGGKNGLGMVINDAAWDGDAKIMREVLDRFREDTISKIIEAKAKGWKI